MSTSKRIEAINEVEILTEGMVRYDAEKSALLLGGHIIEHLVGTEMEEKELQRLIEFKQIEGLFIQSCDEGFCLQIKLLKTEVYLIKQRGEKRVFKSLDTLANFLRKLGVKTVKVEL
jgi:hypothetical protein